MEKLISRKEAAKLLGISIATLDAARNSGLSNLVLVDLVSVRVRNRSRDSLFIQSAECCGSQALFTIQFLLIKRTNTSSENHCALII